MIEFALNVLWWYGVVVIVLTTVFLLLTLLSSKDSIKLWPILWGFFVLYVASHMQGIHSAEMDALKTCVTHSASPKAGKPMSAIGS